MFIRKRERTLILTYLFTEGVMTTVKDFNSEFEIQPADDLNPTAITVPNLQVIKLMQSLDSKGFVRTTFNWSHYYWFLTEEGIDYLREFLHIPADVKPLTAMKPAIPQPAARDDGPRNFGRRRDGDRDRDRGDRDGGRYRRTRE